MSDVVKKSRRDELIARFLLFRKHRTLQHVLGHRDGLAEIFLGSSLREDPCKEWNDRIPFESARRHVGRPCSSIAASVDSNPSLSA